MPRSNINTGLILTFSGRLYFIASIFYWIKYISNVGLINREYINVTIPADGPSVIMRSAFNRWGSSGLGAERTQGRRPHLRLSIVVCYIYIVTFKTKECSGTLLLA